MNYDLLFALIFYIILYSLFLKYRSRFDVQGKIFVLYRTQLGIKLMEKIANKFPRALHILGYISIFLGFIGMATIFSFLIGGTFSLFFKPEAPPVLTPVLPGVETIPGAPILSFWHWIVSIFLIAIVHEFMHGVYAKRYAIPIKSSGFAFLGPLLAAFVEPDETIMKKKKTRVQLAILSAGPFANIISAALTLILILLVFNPLTNSLTSLEGVQIVNVDKGYPIAQTNITPGTEILAINNQPIKTYEDFSALLQQQRPGATITLTTNTTRYPILLGADPTNPEKPLLGVQVQPARVVLHPFFKTHSFLYAAYAWLMQLLFWIFTINLGVGLFNLLPLGPIDGGRMFLAAATRVLKNQEKARKLWMFVSLFCLILIFINLLPFIVKFLRFIFIPVQYILTLLF